MIQKRKSWDTSIKHLVRHGVLDDVLTSEQIRTIPRSNLSRWKYESDDKYTFCEINSIVKEEIDLIKRMNQSSKIKRINQNYFKLCDAFHQVIFNVKGVKTLVRNNKEFVVNTIESVRDSVPIEKALKVFNISRSTFENYKSIVIHKCNISYFNWCVKRFSSQLLPIEVQTIKNYMLNDNYKNWSKVCVYLKAIRDEKLKCCLSTFYKYCRLLGFNNKPRKQKSDDYHPIKTSRPNELWCADVTVFKTSDNAKHYIHFLMDHFSKYVIGYRVCKNPNSTAIKTLLQEAILKHKPNRLQFLTDGGSENVNMVISDFIGKSQISIAHIIAQKDVIFSNSMIEALNKTIKHEFLFLKPISNGNQLGVTLERSVFIYNTIRPQMSLGGNTPVETFNGLSVCFSRYSKSFSKHSVYRRQQNRKQICDMCF